MSRTNIRRSASWKKLLRAYESTCLYCDRYDQELTIDHIVAISKGGPDSIYNVVLACNDCNSNKQNLSIVDFIIQRKLDSEKIALRLRRALFILESFRVRARRQGVPFHKNKHRGAVDINVNNSRHAIQKDLIRSIEALQPTGE